MTVTQNDAIGPIHKAECPTPEEAQGSGVSAYEGRGFLPGVRMFWNQTYHGHMARRRC